MKVCPAIELFIVWRTKKGITSLGFNWGLATGRVSSHRKVCCSKDLSKPCKHGKKRDIKMMMWNWIIAQFCLLMDYCKRSKAHYLDKIEVKWAGIIE